jgi:hypothetical protein
MTKVSLEDWMSINDFWSRYSWAFDDGKADEWAALWTEDGTFAGIEPQDVVGHKELKRVCTGSFADCKGGLRHLYGNLLVAYDGADKNVVKGKLYNYVSTWGMAEQSGNFTMALCQITMVRHGDSWKLKRNDAQLLVR